MKKIQLLTSIAFFCISSAFAQPAFNPVEKGNKQAGLQMMVAPTDMFWSETALKINKNNKTYGLHVAGSYGWFVERGWMVGLQSNIGFYHDQYGGNEPWGVNEDIFDISIAPMTRYYFTVDKKHRFKPFLFAGMPIVYNDVNRTYNSNSWNTDVDENYLELRGTFGFGTAYFGKAGSIELNLSNMGFFLGVNKFIQPKKK
jgi:hypothetical protein